ncbi:hypothetical protein WNY79_20155 [Pseudoalteromonas sp. AS84]|uniref:hypothetical protein n=1 Tax=Pseudoalteromonas sp. AS84 TaxID=3135778 RepID=UPI00317C68BD
MNSRKVLKLRFQTTIIAELNIVSSDQPWFYCEFTALKSFSEHRNFFYNFQEEYSSGTVKDWDTFFNRLNIKGYSLRTPDSEIERFILLWGDSESSVRLRGRRVKNT